MDDYAREMMDLKTLVTRTLEKRGVLARIRAELRANVFAAIEEEDRAMENDENASFALLGRCNEQAKQLHASPTGKLLSALVCDYLEWCQLDHTLKVFLPECNLPNGFWKEELKEKLGHKMAAGTSKEDHQSPILLEILESYLKDERSGPTNLTGSFAKLALRRSTETGASPANDEPQTVPDKSRPSRRSSSASSSGNLPHIGRKGGVGLANNSTSSMKNYQVSTSNEQISSDESGKTHP